jgi:hypothetical protein
MEHIDIMKILCTGNPADATVASAVKKQFPSAEFASRTTGYDLRFWDPGSEQHFRDQIKKYDVFINSSFICGGGQLALLETTWQEWSNNQIHGHIINIGSSAEYLGVTDPQVDQHVYGAYSIQKRALRDRSLQLNNKKGIQTSHITAGGLDDGRPENAHALSLDIVAQTIAWILQNPANIPLVAVENKRVDQ